jgi:hypothetical protein
MEKSNLNLELLRMLKESYNNAIDTIKQKVEGEVADSLELIGEADLTDGERPIYDYVQHNKKLGIRIEEELIKNGISLVDLNEIINALSNNSTTIVNIDTINELIDKLKKK